MHRGMPQRAHLGHSDGSTIGLCGSGAGALGGGALGLGGATSVTL